MNFKLYRVGGSIRDKILGLEINDIDYSILCLDSSADKNAAFNDVLRMMKSKGCSIVYENKDLLTFKVKHNDIYVDYTLCRKEYAYDCNYKPTRVEIGTLYDDLERRDFTMNAIALDEFGNYIDPFGGVDDIKAKAIRCIGNAHTKLEEDPTRVLRAIRFSITLPDFTLDQNIIDALNDTDICNLMQNVPVEYKRKELDKCFKYDTSKTIMVLANYPLLTKNIFVDGFWLYPTSKKF